MSFDGIIRPSQILSHADPMNPYQAAYAAEQTQKNQPKVTSPKKSRNLDKVQKQLQQYEGTDPDEDQEGLSEEELEEVLLFAKLRGMIEGSFKDGVTYIFEVNEETGLVDLVEKGSGQVVLTMTPDELMAVSRKIERYAGVLTDRSA